MKLLRKRIIEKSKEHILVVAEEEEAAVAIKVVVEGAAVGTVEGVP